jgi:hypothetical protein
VKKELKFPSILGIIFLLLAIGGGIYLTQSKAIFNSSASGTCQPDSVQVTNITNNSASISFLTTSLCTFSLSVNNQTFTDIKTTPSHLHYFEVKRLADLTDYKFTLISNGNPINSDQYIFKTGSSPGTTIPTSNLAWGRVFNQDKKTPATAVVFLNIPGASPLSSIVTTNGNWSVSLANSFNEAKNNWFSPPVTAIGEDIIVISEEGTPTQVSNTTDKNNPVPNITIGENFLSAPEETNKTVSGKLDLGAAPVIDKKVDIFNPKDGDILSTGKPDFFGSAPTDSTVIIEVHSSVPINGQTNSNTAGEWHWSPPENLPPGEHTITVKVQNKTSGVWETVTRKFIVLASDTQQPQFEASASASTPTPTIIPTDTPVPTVRVAQVSTESAAPPVTGNSLPTVIILVSALLFFIISVNFLK